MPEHSLMAIVEVDKRNRIACQAAGCNRPVFKKIHVILESGSFKVLGGECYKKLYGSSGVRDPKPYYGSSEGRRLTDEERRLLIENTEKLIEQLEVEHKQLALSSSPPVNCGGITTNQPLCVAPQLPDRTSGISYEIAERQVKAALRAMGIDPDMPGWVGLVKLRAKKLVG
jgi:hypothetical protein